MTDTPDRPALTRGQVVLVREPGLAPWAGLVQDVKWSPEPKGPGTWRAAVRRNDDYLTFSVPVALISSIDTEGATA